MLELLSLIDLDDFLVRVDDDDSSKMTQDLLITMVVSHAALGTKLTWLAILSLTFESRRVKTTPSLGDSRKHCLHLLLTPSAFSRRAVSSSEQDLFKTE